MRLKEALVGAHQNFRQNPDMDELNLLFLACGDFTQLSGMARQSDRSGRIFYCKLFSSP